LIFRLLATTAGTPVIIEAISDAGSVSHRLAVPEGRAGIVVQQMRAALPGLDAGAGQERTMEEVNRMVELRLSTRRRPLRTDDPVGVSRAVLTALAHVGRGEMLGLQWVLRRSVIPTAVSNQIDGVAYESWLAGMVAAPFRSPRQPDAELRGALRAKHGEPGWQLVGRLAVRAASKSRQRQLIRQVLGALRSAEAPGVGFRVRSAHPRRFMRPVLPWRAPLRLNINELAAVSAFPVGETASLPVDMIGSRLVAPSGAIPRRGLVIAQSTFPGRERQLALSSADLRRHMHLLGPSGSGKSTLLLNMVVQAMQAGQAVVVIEPKSDLIAAVLERVPEHRVKDVVLMDATDTERPVGLNPLASGGRSAELVADQLLGLFHSLYASHWGPRTQDILGASLLTLARVPGMSLAALPLLLTNPGVRRRVVPLASDPIGLGPFWSSYEAWSEQERTTAIAPTLNRLRPLLMRPEIRGIVGQSKPRFDLRQVFTQRKILLVDLAKGQLGPETAALLGSLLIAQLWAAVLGRSAIPPERRHTALIVVDEFQDYIRLPLDFADALAQARGLGAAFVLAHQYLNQVDGPMRSAVLANAQSRVAFRLPSEDARVIAADSTLDPQDFQGLRAFDCYVQMVAKDTVQPWCSARTLPPTQPISDPSVIRAASRETYGTPREEIDADLQRLILGSQSKPGRPGHPRLRSADVGAGGGAAAWLAARGCVGGNGRRVASNLALPPTPLIITILVTNGDFLEDAS
jgi:RecA/RadA recombinase